MTEQVRVLIVQLVAVVVLVNLLRASVSNFCLILSVMLPNTQTGYPWIHLFHAPGLV